MPTVANETGSAMDQPMGSFESGPDAGQGRPTGSIGREPPGLGLSGPDEGLETRYDERELIQDVADPVGQYVQHYPMKSVVIAACIGALFGMLFLRR